MSRLPLLLLLVYVLPGVLCSAIIGVDFGSKFIKVASVQPGKPFDIVLNENSKRKSEQCLAFDTETRLYGSTAYAYASRSPDRVVSRVRDLLGCGIDCPELVNLKKHNIVYDVQEDPLTKSVRIVIDSESVYNSETLVGMILSYIKRLSEDYTEDTVVDCVLTVPPFFTQIQREALLNAADIAGLKVISLIDETTAAAVQHGIYNEFTNETTNILIFNMGAASTKVNVFAFSGVPSTAKKLNSKVVTLGKGWDAFLGGDDFDAVLVNLFADHFDKTYYKDGKKSVRNNARAMARIEKEANKVKVVLSANMEIPVSIESLDEGRDFKMHITRKQFMELSKSLLDRVTKPIDIALEKSGLTISDIDAVELIGGGVRIPRIKKVLKEYFESKELGTHLDGDESAVFGSVFVGANMSKAFRVRPVHLVDITGDQVSVELSELVPPEGGEELWKKSTELYAAGYPLNAKKVVSFKYEKGSILCDLTRADTSIAQYEISGIEAAIEEFGKHGPAKVSLSFLLSLNDTVFLSKAEATFIEDVVPAKEEEEEEVEKEEESSDDKEAATKKKKKKKQKKEEPITHRYELTVVRTDTSLSVKPLSGDVIDDCKQILATMNDKETEMRQHEGEKNALESFIFSSRDKIRSDEDTVDLVLSQEDKSSLFDDLMELEDWLDDEGAKAPIKVYKVKKQEMNKRIAKIMERASELDQRPASIKAAKGLLESITKQIAEFWPEERPWITDDEVATVKASMQAFSTWLEGAQKAQEAIGLQADMVLKSSDIATQLEPLHFMIEEALKRPMPRPKKVTVNETSTEEEKDAPKENEASKEQEASKEKEEL